VLNILCVFILNAMPSIEYIMTCRAGKKPLVNAAIFVELRMKAILVSAGWAGFKFFFYYASRNVIGHTIILLETL